MRFTTRYDDDDDTVRKSLDGLRLLHGAQMLGGLRLTTRCENTNTVYDYPNGVRIVSMKYDITRSIAILHYYYDTVSQLAIILHGL